MVTDEIPLREYELASAVDLSAALDRSGIEYLDVTEQRVIVIYNQAVLDLRAGEADLSEVSRFTVEMIATPIRGSQSDSVALLERFVDEVASWVEAEWDVVSHS